MHSPARLQHAAASFGSMRMASVERFEVRPTRETFLEATIGAPVR
jgi:hypothetical protein